MALLFFANDRCKAWRKKIPERSEDDFFPANQPDRAALHSQWQRAIFAVRNEIMEYYVGLYFIIKHVLYALYQVRFLHCLRMWVLNVECRLVL
ncbi:hypothetical protein PL531_00690 [Phocaeicola vulgatus]|nr:hypothetical protein [Phocaeicola vulgatus]